MDSYLGILSLPNETIEKIFIKVGDGKDKPVTISTSKKKYEGFSYMEDEFVIISCWFAEFFCYFFTDQRISIGNYLLGVWGSDNYLLKNECTTGRIMLTQNFSNKDLKDWAGYIDLSNSLSHLSQEIEDISIIGGFRKYFLDRKGLDKNSNDFDALFDGITALSKKFSKEFDEFKGIKDQISLDLKELKDSLSQSSRSDKQNVVLDLKFQVAQGKTRAVLNKLKEVKDLENSEFFNEYILLFSNYSKFQQSFNLNLISEDQANLELNRINKGLLELIDKLAAAQKL